MVRSRRRRRRRRRWGSRWLNEARASCRRYGSDSRRPARNWMCSAVESGACDEQRTARTRDPVHYILFIETVVLKTLRPILFFYYFFFNVPFHILFSSHSTYTHRYTGISVQFFRQRGLGALLYSFFFFSFHF